MTVRQREELIPVLAEIFRTHGYEGASLARIADATGLGKGSLYHAFPGGKEDMANAVLDHIDHWFAQNVFAPLSATADGAAGIDRMFEEVNGYFMSGRRVCLIGAFALTEVRDRFSVRVRTYFVKWAAVLHAALLRGGSKPEDAVDLTEEILAGIQGALVLARAIDDPAIFLRTLDRLQRRLQRTAP